MALTRCCECNREISDKAVSCPSCGCPTGLVITNTIATAKVDERKEIFQVGQSSFVLSEIVALSEFGYRRWVSVFCAITTLVFSLLLFRETWNEKMPIYFCGILFLVGSVITITLLAKNSELASTGGNKSLNAPYNLVLKNYCSRVPDRLLIHYIGNNLIHTMKFVINADRVARYEVCEKSQFFNWFILSCVLFSSSIISSLEGGTTIVSVFLFVLSIISLAIGIYSGRAMIKIVGVGGSIVDLYVSQKDSKRIQDELRLKIKDLAK